MQALYDFINRGHLDPNHHANKYREELRILRQRNISPEKYYARFADLNRLVGNLDFKTNPNHIFAYFHGLWLGIRNTLKER